MSKFYNRIQLDQIHIQPFDDRVARELGADEKLPSLRKHLPCNLPRGFCNGFLLHGAPGATLDSSGIALEWAPSNLGATSPIRVAGPLPQRVRSPLPSRHNGPMRLSPYQAAMKAFARTRRRWYLAFRILAGRGPSP
jgi:hypothetical protein